MPNDDKVVSIREWQDRRPSNQPVSSYTVTFEFGEDNLLDTVRVPAVVDDRIAGEQIARNLETGATWLRDELVRLHGESEDDVIAYVAIERSGRVRTSTVASFPSAAHRWWLLRRLRTAYRDLVG